MRRTAIVFDAAREGYGIDQVRNPMTVKELREILEDCEDDDLVILSHDRGYTYGSPRYPVYYCEGSDGEWGEI